MRDTILADESYLELPPEGAHEIAALEDYDKESVHLKEVNQEADKYKGIASEDVVAHVKEHYKNQILIVSFKDLS